MSSSSSYGSYSQTNKATYTSRPSTSSTSYSSNASSSLYTQSGSSSRGARYSKPPVIHNGGGQIYDPNTSTSAPNGGYHS
ncbi:hypothetical protein T440DRAFT_512711 [Plenodomus tracheiphilus IPT5]|uniref:Uncharacterized protein n=1 Tax=Plenodomus tracheiphilus IPT5 TaxID=1408161 RepID=A0A6A7BMU7_9PLEO|nr:hypothetical protein T440DRAFT_512711 [Plenodomus tracheiphilus IPT5]